ARNGSRASGLLRHLPGPPAAAPLRRPLPRAAADCLAEPARPGDPEPAQRDLFLTTLRAYGRDSRSPFHIEEALQGSFSLSTSRLIRVRERHGEKISQEDQPASSSSGLAASPSAPDSSPTTGPAAGTVTRYPVTQLYFQFRPGPGTHGVQGFTISSRP